MLTQEWRKLFGRLFQVVGAVKEKDLWPKILVGTRHRGTVRIRESVNERGGRARLGMGCASPPAHLFIF